MNFNNTIQLAAITVTDLTLCTTSLYEARKEIHSSNDEEIRSAFCPQTALVAHFVSKLLPDNEDTNSDHMPVASGRQ